MPIYEFHCMVCNTKFDELVYMGTTHENCPKCGAAAHKSAGSFKSVAHGLENGHHAVGHKLTGGVKK